MESQRKLLISWYRQGVIRHELPEVMTRIGVLPGHKDWQQFIQRLLFWLGGLALAFSVVFFIAYNWDAMGRFAKFAMLELLVLASVLAYARLGADKLLSKVVLAMGSIFVGVLLAFFGQTYQTGADPWQLFATWALMIIPWAIIAEFAALWILVITLINVAMLLYTNTMGHVFWMVVRSDEQISWLMFLFNGLLWVIWEFAAMHFAWLRERWAVRLIAIVAGTSVTLLMLEAIFDSADYPLMAAIGYFLMITGIYLVYRRKLPDLFMLAGLCLSVITVVTSQLAEALFRHGNETGSFLLMSILVIGMAAVAAIWLKRVHREQIS